MGKHNLAKFFRHAQVWTTKHSPEILTGLGIAGMVTTTVLAVRATPKALELLQDAEIKKIDEQVIAGVDPDEIVRLTPAEVVKAAWKPYIPAAVTGAVSIACLVGASTLNARRNAALAAAYKLSETALLEYQDKVIETIGEKKELSVREKVSEEQVQKHPVSKSEVIITGGGDTLCFDPMSSRHFYSDIDRIKKAENELNRRMLHDIFGYVSLNEFYDEIGLERTDIGDIVGWNTEKLIDIGISSHVADNGKPSIVLDYRNRPTYEYDK
jgi:hypothetical protein